MKRRFVFLTLILVAFSSCNNKLNKALQVMKEMPPANYSYVVQPVFRETKEIAETQTKNFFNADEVKIGAIGFHKYDPETRMQKDQRYLLQVVLLNSKSVVDFTNEEKMNGLGKEIAKYVVSQISNNDKYDRIEVSFIIKEANSQNVWRQNIFYKLPDYDLTQMSDR